MAFEVAWDLASSLSKERYLRISPKLTFNDDIKVSSVSEWMLAGIGYQYDGMLFKLSLGVFK